jgi:hypothetical protein
MTLITKESGARRFDFARDRFAFANELLWEYKSGSTAGKMNFRKREPKPDYAHRCFVLVRAARQFLYHARFEPDQKIASDETCRDLICQVVSRSPRKPSAPAAQIVIPGFASLREFSAAREKLLKAECGGSWQSYILRSHWRMIFPISRRHQTLTAEAIVRALGQNLSPIVHLVKFPSLTINHGMILFDVTTARDALTFSAYDPNHPDAPAQLTFDRRAQTFFLPANSYWAGGKLNVIQIFQSWLM